VQNVTSVKADMNEHTVTVAFDDHRFSRHSFE